MSYNLGQFARLHEILSGARMLTDSVFSVRMCLLKAC
jgi:hypothetical protein